MNETQLVRTIKAHIAKGDKAKDKAEQHYIAAGQYLKQLKDDCPDQQTFLEKVEKEIGIGKSRTYELIQIGDGRKTVAEVRADTAKRVAKHEQSCPLANGQNADDPEASAEARKAFYAAEAPPEQEDAAPDGETEDRVPGHDYEHVADPVIIKKNALDSIADHEAVAEAYRKVFKAARFRPWPAKEIDTAIERLMRKWNTVRSTLGRSTVQVVAAPPLDHQGRPFPMTLPHGSIVSRDHLGYEALALDDTSLGLFPTAEAAAEAVINAVTSGRVKGPISTFPKADDAPKAPSS